MCTYGDDCFGFVHRLACWSADVTLHGKGGTISMPALSILPAHNTLASSKAAALSKVVMPGQLSSAFILTPRCESM